MKKINICGETQNTDSFYRYKREQTKLNSIKNKLQIINIDSIANDINRDVKLLINFLKTYFGINFEYKENILSTTNKKLSVNDFEIAINIFIEYFVLCPQCDLPETKLLMTDKTIFIECSCCPFNGNLLKHKTIKNKHINKFIDNNI